jgi:Uma2 family endonuclease
MIAVSTDYLSIIRALPPGATTIFRNVPWEDYESLLDEITDEPHLRISYNDGVMQIMTTSTDHEELAVLISIFIRVIEDELRIPIQSYRTATFKKDKKQKGTEPDDCFYIQNAAKVIGKKFDIETDPPPDLAIEVDLSSPSLSKFPIYAALGVPELWRYKNDGVKFYQLVNGEYDEVESSPAFPFLSSSTITHFLLQGITDGQTAAKWAFADWVRANKPTA